MPSFWKDIYVREAFLMTFPLLVGSLVRFFLEMLCFTYVSYYILFYSFLSHRFKDKRSSEDASDSGFAVRRRGLFVVLLEAWGH